MLKLMSAICFAAFLSVFGFQKDPTLSGMADNTFMTIQGGENEQEV